MAFLSCLFQNTNKVTLILCGFPVLSSQGPSPPRAALPPSVASSPATKPRAIMLLANSLPTCSPLFLKARPWAYVWPKCCTLTLCSSQYKRHLREATQQPLSLNSYFALIFALNLLTSLMYFSSPVTVSPPHQYVSSFMASMVECTMTE